MHVRTRVDVCVCMHTRGCVRVCACACMHVCMHVCVHVYAHMCVYACVYACVCMCVCMSVQACTCVWACDMIMCASSAGVLCPAMHCANFPLHVPRGHVMH